MATMWNLLPSRKTNTSIKIFEHLKNTNNFFIVRKAAKKKKVKNPTTTNQAARSCHEKQGSETLSSDYSAGKKPPWHAVLQITLFSVTGPFWSFQLLHITGCIQDPNKNMTFQGHFQDSTTCYRMIVKWEKKTVKAKREPFDCISSYRLIFHLQFLRFSFATNSNKDPPHRSRSISQSQISCHKSLQRFKCAQKAVQWMFPNMGLGSFSQTTSTLAFSSVIASLFAQNSHL